MSIPTERKDRSATEHLPPQAPTHEPPPIVPRTTERFESMWIFGFLLAILAGLTLAIVLTPEQRVEPIETDWLPDYEVDSPLVIYREVAGPIGLIGIEADLDPDLPRWAQSEYEVDTALVTYTEAPAFWVGSDASFDDDSPAWMQTEYYEDTSLIVYRFSEVQTLPTLPGWLVAELNNNPAGAWFGGDAGLDPDSPAWMQAEYDRDTPLIVTTPTSGFWVGGDADLN